MIVGVVGNAPRKTGHLFTPRSARSSSNEATRADGSPNVEVEIFRNLLVEFARERGATAIVKGLRAISDFEYEFEMNQLNRKLGADIESVYIFASPDYSFLSLDRGQGDGDLRRRRLRPRARRGRRGARRSGPSATHT